MSFSPVRLSHAVPFVSDLEPAVRSYTEVLGMEEIAREPRANAAFLRPPNSDDHHDLGLFGLGPSAAPRQRGAVDLHHLDWQLDTVDELVGARCVLFGPGAYTGESSHGATKNLYGVDLDGTEFEIMWMLPCEAWGAYEHAATVGRLDLEAEVERFSGVRTGWPSLESDGRLQA